MEIRGDKEIKTSGNKDIKTVLLADDYFTVGDSEDALHIPVLKLDSVTL